MLRATPGAAARPAAAGSLLLADAAGAAPRRAFCAAALRPRRRAAAVCGADGFAAAALEPAAAAAAAAAAPSPPAVAAAPAALAALAASTSGAAARAASAAGDALRAAAGRWAPAARQLLFGPAALGGGAAGAAPLALAAAALPAALAEAFAELMGNRVFLVGFWAWFLAQFLKIFTRRWKSGVWDVRAMVDSGGMPSSHSAFCAGVTTAIATQHGLGSSLFALGLCFTLIVMYDAAGVRRHAGKQAEVLNQVINELLDDHPMSDVKLKEVLGHTPLQVFAGAVLGVAVGVLMPGAGGAGPVAA